MHLPTISIVTPSFNQAKYLRRNLESIVSQEGVTVEQFVMDGGSTDDTRRILETRGGHLAFWRSEKDGGQTKALIEGFSRSTGEIMGWLNSDDFLWDAQAMRHVSEAFAKHPDVDMVSGDTVLTASDGTPLLIDMPWRPSARLMRYNMCAPQQSTFWRRRAYEAVGGLDPNFQYCMDFDLFQRMSQGRTMLRIPHVLAAFRLHETSKTSTWGEVFRREVALCQNRTGRGFGHKLGIKTATMEIRLGALLAEAQAIVTGRKLPCYMNARIEPMRAYVRRKWNLEG